MQPKSAQLHRQTWRVCRRRLIRSHYQYGRRVAPSRHSLLTPLYVKLSREYSFGRLKPELTFAAMDPLLFCQPRAPRDLHVGLSYHLPMVISHVSEAEYACVTLQASIG